MTEQHRTGEQGYDLTSHDRPGQMTGQARCQDKTGQNGPRPKKTEQRNEQFPPISIDKFSCIF